MEGVNMKFMIPVSPRLVKSLLATHQTANTSLQLSTTPVMVVQDVPDNSINLMQIPNSDLIVRNVNLNLPVKNVQQPCSSLRSVRTVHAPKIQDSSQENCDAEESTSDIEEIEVLPNPKYIQPSATKILSSGKYATVQKIIESLPKEPEVITVDEPTEPIRKKGGKPAKNLKETYFRCDICEEEFKKRYLYQRHMHEHSQEKPHHCPKCSASFNVPTNFTLHMATHNIGEPKCPMCNKRFARIASLKTHMAMHEKDENLYCPECDGVFETKLQLEAHMKLHDTDKRPSEDFRKCKLCRAKFTHPALYRQHLRDHYKVQTKIERLTKHGIVRQRIINSCRICKKSFEKPSQLARHLRVHTGEKPYKCNLCNRGFTQKGSLKIHMWQHEGNRPHSCAFCDAKFSQKGNLKTHIQKTHKVQKGSPVYRCTNCTCIFKTLGSLNNHINRVHSEDKETAAKNQEQEEEDAEKAEDNEDEVCFAMDQIDKNRVQNTNSTKASGEDESGKENEKIEGDGDKDLEEGFVVMDNEETATVTVLDKASSEVEKKYIKITQKYMNNSKVYVCSYCDKDFKKPSDLMRHLRVHTMEKPFKCKVCKRGFTLKSTLLAHMRVHKAEDRFRCQICNTTWRSEQELNDHEKLHAEHYVCGICEKQFTNFTALKTHTMTDHEMKKSKKKVSDEARSLAGKVQLKDPLELKVASNGLLLAEPKHRNDLINGRGRPHKCPSCPAAFMKLSHLKQHHRKHTGERPFECHVCNKTFTTISALNCHVRTHDYSKPFKCPVCSLHFTTNSSMKRHLVTHTNKRPYMCPYCNKTFKTTVNCRKHMKIHKLEIAEEEVEKQKRGGESPQTNEPTVITIRDGITLQPIVIQADPAVDPLLQTSEAENNQPYISGLPTSQNVLTIGQNLSIVNDPNVAASQKHLANETGTVTLVSYPSGEPFTPDNMKALEDSLNQQLLNISMNLQNQATSMTQNPPILRIIYNDGKTYETQINTSANSNNFGSQLNTYDINQMSLQTIKNEIEREINPATSTSILPDPLQESSNLTQPATIQFDFTSLQNGMPKFASTKTNRSPGNQVMEDSNLQCHMCQKREFTTETLKEHLKTHQGTREYECTYCLSKFCSSGGLSRHMKIHETPEKHKCYDCKQEFTTSRELTVHIKEHVRQELEQKNDIGPNETIDVGLKDANDKKNNECAYCSKIFRKPSDLIRHIRTHTGERPYQCPHCEKSFAVKCTLDSHVKAHDGVKEFHCYVCNNVFATKGSLKVHMRLHTGDKPFKCDTCDARFRTSGHRKVHMVAHTRRKTRKSPKQNQNETTTSPSSTTETSNECSPAQMMMNPEFVPNQLNDQIVPNNQNQFENMTLDHTLNTITLNSVNEQITFNADGTILSDSSGLLNLSDNNQLVANLQYLLSNGMVSVQVDNPTISPQLPTSAVDINPSDFEQIDTNEAQKQMSDPQVIFASQTFNSNPSMTNVDNFDLENCMVMHMDEVESLTEPAKETNRKQAKTLNPVTRRECDICGKAFSKPCQVERHKRVHTGERPYKCDLCDKCFAQKSTLQMHKKHHSGDRPYPCPQCERSFTQSGNLHTHLKRIHKIDPADVKRLTKLQSANCDAKLSVDDIFIDFSLADLLR